MEDFTSWFLHEISSQHLDWYWQLCRWKTFFDRLSEGQYWANLLVLAMNRTISFSSSTIKIWPWLFKLSLFASSWFYYAFSILNQERWIVLNSQINPHLHVIMIDPTEFHSLDWLLLSVSQLLLSWSTDNWMSRRQPVIGAVNMALMRKLHWWKKASLVESYDWERSNTKCTNLIL